ncbi:MAG: muconolactone Delta-isomerase family protein [Acidimicrobiales bacterium]
MEFLTTMITSVPEGTLESEVDSMKLREAAHARELAARGHLVRLWKRPVEGSSRRSLLGAQLSRSGLLGRRSSVPHRQGAS